eukprot:scaffold40631_cov16-Prasinocladus_malaysianus.AAC.1
MHAFRVCGPGPTCRCDHIDPQRRCVCLRDLRDGHCRAYCTYVHCSTTSIEAHIMIYTYYAAWQTNHNTSSSFSN